VKVVEKGGVAAYALMLLLDDAGECLERRHLNTIITCCR
jgi:hypothetical protein